ncbi:hypothetical protein SLE2022_228800 [Rubroshorea leprosula]
MGKGRPRAVQTGQSLGVSCSGLIIIPEGPVFHPTEEEFRDPLEYIYKIRPQAEPYGICKIVPPKGWSPPFALNSDSFTFPTKTQAIHQLQARPASCDSKTFELEYSRFLEGHCGKKLKKKVVFEGEELDLCKLFNGARRFGGYDKVVKDKKWGEVFKFVRAGGKISGCAKHILCEKYREHLYDYECYYNRLNRDRVKSCKRRSHEDVKRDEVQLMSSKRRRKNGYGDKAYLCKMEEKEDEHDQICEQCESGLHGEVMLLCDRCNKGWHIYCLSPPLKQVPPGNWYCLECLNSDKDSFGFVPGKQYSLEAFRRVADRAKRKWFGSRPASRAQMEKKFWEIVEGSAGEVEVMYGSDLDTSVYGSGFPRLNDQRPESIEAKVWEEYCSNPWNLNNLPKLKGSMLRVVNHNITGVMVPWLYIGMLFSAFCWHFEDHCFYSMNYLHWGEPKCWYSVPGSEASAFEKVMRSCLPDLFDSQPDLLFQLVTMLNPSVLRENGVPVYSVLQEPGNFVITFPRSYHGGFNLGLNCAEAVNFAPADWLPHGGSGAELYKLYRKAAVLSHEELLCVVAKSDWDSKASPYLRKELLRMYTKERSWREKLWKCGMIRSSPMPPKKSSEYVGSDTEEDRTCIICKQYLYLSAVVCRCRPLEFVCLEHWEHLCECQSRKHRLLYRHNLAELCDLVLKVDIEDSEEAPRSDSSRRQVSGFNKKSSLAKKVKGTSITYAQLAEQWLVRSREVLQSPYSGHAYATLLKESEQFLWAGTEMDSVRDAVNNLIEAQKWAKGITDCLSKVENQTNNPGEKVHLDYVDKLLSVDPLPCNESEHLKLKDFVEEARLLDREIEAALSTSSKINELELLYSKAHSLPIHLKQSEKLSKKLSSAKAWKECAIKHLLDKSSVAIDIDFLYQLRSEILELLVEVPETEMLSNLLSQAEACQAHCKSLLSGSITLKDVKVLLQGMDGLNVNIPELTVLKQYHIDASRLIDRFNSILVNVHEREDQQTIVDELDCILKEGATLGIQVDEMPLVKIELEKACCREKALKARNTKMPLDSLQQLEVEAVKLRIEGEKSFADVSRVVAAAMHWEERANDVLARNAHMSEFVDLLRTSEDIGTILPSLEIVKDAVSKAETWLEKSKPFLEPDLSVASSSCFSLKLEDLQELVSESKFLMISLEEQSMVEIVLKKCMEWEHGACSLLQEVECLYNTIDIGDGKSNGLVSKIQQLVTSLKSVINSSLSLGFNFHEIAKLENACSTLQWCNQVLLFCDGKPSCEDVERLMAVAEHLSIMCTSHTMLSSLIYGVKWLRKASDVIPAPLNCQTCRLSDAEEILAEYKDINVSFPMMVAQVTDAIRKHGLWQEDVCHFFALEFKDRSLSQMVELKESGKGVAFTCTELDMVLSEVEKVEKWKQRCSNIIGTLAGDVCSLPGALEKIKESLGKSLDIYEKLRGSEGKYLCMLCASYENLEFLTCSTCKNCYHLRCLRLKFLEAHNCPSCHFFLGELVPQDGSGFLASGKQPDLKMLTELLSDGETFCVRIEEKDLLQQLVDQAFACRMRLTEIVDFEMSYLDKDLTVVSNKLTAALKAIEVAITYDDQGNCNLVRALARHSWRLRVNCLLDSSEKPTIKQIQQLLKEGMDLNILPGDYFRKKLTELEDTALQWADRANKVVADSGALGLDKVYELIVEGEKLPVLMEKELELLRARSMLHCICRKPYEERSMIACSRCGEWYHIACVKLVSSPKSYICAACKPQTEDELSLSPLLDDLRLTSTKFVEPKTPSPQHTKPRKRPKILGASVRQKIPTASDSDDNLRRSSGMDRLWWQNRKPFRRVARKRSELESLTRFF